VGNIGDHVLEKIGSISVARSSGTGRQIVGYVAGQNWHAEGERTSLDCWG
jgi:hypothetical protein